MNYFAQLFDLMVEVMLPVTLLVAAGVEAATPPMLTALLLADRFKLDSAATALLIGWATILFWVTLPLIMGLGLVR